MFESTYRLVAEAQSSFRYETEARLAQQREVKIKPLEIKEARMLFAKVLGWQGFQDIPKRDEELADYLLNEIGGLVLGIQQIATHQISRFERRHCGIRRVLSEVSTSYSDRQDGHTLTTLWKMTFDLIRSK